MTEEHAQAHGNASKVAKPDLYRGDRAKLEEWLLQVDLYFKFAGDAIDETDKASFVTTYMRGDAARWINPYLTKYLDELNEEDDIIQLFENYDQFKTRLRQVFGISNEASTASRIIQRLRQQRSAAEYAAEFQHHAIQTQWDDKALMVMYKQGLKNSVKAELMRTGASLDTLDRLYEESIRIDGDLFELNMDTRREQPQNGFGKVASKRYFPPIQRSQQSSVDPYGPQKMQLDTITRGEGWKGKPKRGSFPTSKETRTCYGCGKPGHISRNCRSKNKVTRQLNVLSTPSQAEDVEDEWEVVNPDKYRLMKDEETGADSLDSATTEEFYSTDEQPPAKRQKVNKQGSYRTAHQDDPVWGYLEEPEQDLSEQDKLEIYQEIKEQTTVYNEANILSYQEEQAHTHSDQEDIFSNSRQRRPRRSRTILQERLRDRQPNWEDDLGDQPPRNRIRREDATLSDTSAKPQYYLDYRNNDHAKMSWTICNHDHCSIHYSDKVGTGWFPSRRSTCKVQWYDCTNDSCETHLWDKRERPYFPGKDDPAELLQMHMLINGVCKQTQWQTCLHPDCTTHQEGKKANGFDEKTFLGERMAPGIDPGTATPPTRNL